MTTKVITKKDLLTLKETEEMLGVSNTQLRDLTKQHGLKKVKDKLNLNYTFYLKSSIEEFMNNRFFVVGEE